MKSKGFTLIELLVVIAIIALLMGILMPALNRARQLAQRLVCGAQLKGIGTAMVVYAADNKDGFPRAGGEGSTWSTNGKIRQWAVTPSGILQEDEDDAFGTRRDADGHITTVGQATVTSSLYLLIKYASVTPAQFICKGDGANVFKLPAVGAGAKLRLEEAWDFGAYHGGTKPMDPPGMCNSYAYNMPYTWPAPDPSGKTILRTSFVIDDAFNPGSAVAADRNPHLDNRSMADEDEHRNSTAHQDKGQNVLYKDNSLEWRADVTYGIGGDNIYTHGGNEADGFGVGDGEIPTGNGDSGPNGRPDAYLVSELNFH